MDSVAAVAGDDFEQLEAARDSLTAIGTHLAETVRPTLDRRPTQTERALMGCQARDGEPVTSLFE